MAEFSRTMQPVSDDQFLASAICFLLDGGDKDAAKILLSCSLSLQWTISSQNLPFDQNPEEPLADAEYSLSRIILLANRTAYDILENEGDIPDKIFSAFGAIIGHEHYNFVPVVVKAEIIDIDENWRESLWQISEDKLADNQENWYSTNVHHWLGFRFSSKTEIRIAQALDKRGLLFFPNCRARMGSLKKRTKGAPDFLICHNGKWGILEVDGEPFHPPQRAAQHHEDDRIYKENHGLKVIERFNASECFENADGVVQRFLKILEQS